MDGVVSDERRPFAAVVSVARGVVIAAGALATLPVVATLLLRQIPVQSPTTAAYVAGTPFVPAAGVVSIVLFGIVRFWSGVAIATGLTTVLVLTQVPMFLGSAAPPGPSTEVTVMTVNLHVGLGDAAEIVDTVRRSGVEVLAVEELTPTAMTALAAAGLDELLPHSITTPSWDTDGNGLWSRRPLARLTPPPDFGHPPVAATMELAGRVVFVAVVHLVSPYPANARQWAAELDRLEEWLDTVEGPAVVAGDFNATPDHRQFRDVLATGFRDAAEQVGSGFLPTYPANRRRLPLMITIDHVLARQGIVAIDVTRLDIAGTDHSGLLAVLAVPDRE